MEGRNGCGRPGVCLRLSLTQSGGRGGDAGDKRMQKRAATCLLSARISSRDRIQLQKSDPELEQVSVEGAVLRKAVLASSQYLAAPVVLSNVVIVALVLLLI